MLTFSDVYEHMLDVFYQNGKDVARSARVLKRSIDSAYKSLLSIHDWEYFRRTTSIVTTPSETHASTSYSAATGRITLSTGTWNADVEFGSILMDGARFRVTRRISDTVIEISGGPTANYTGSVTWQQFRYLLPIDVGDVHQLMDNKFSLGIQRIAIDHIWWFQTVINAETYPIGWNIFPSAVMPGRWELWLSGANTQITQFELLYQARAADLSFTELATNTTNGTVSISGSTATVSKAVLNSRHVGSVLRVSGDASVPTNGYGRLKKNVATGQYETDLNPYEQEFLIETVDSSTTATLSTAGITVSGKGYTISPHIDVNREGMEQLLYRMCEHEYDSVTRADSPVWNASMRKFDQALRLAMGADGTVVKNRPRGVYSGTVIQE